MSTVSVISGSGVTIKRRIALALLIVGVLIGLLAVRLCHILIFQNPTLKSKALDQRLQAMPVDARRGFILDRNGSKLAVSVSADSVYAVPAQVKDPEYTARKLSKVLEIPYKKILDMLKTRQASVYIARRIDLDTAQKIKELKLPGIKFTEKGLRVYPFDGLAAHVLGISGIDNNGVEGIEREYDRFLAGKKGQILSERDGRGREIPQGIGDYIPPQDGYDVVLTIDETIQHITERELDRAMMDTNSKRGIVIVMDPKTGDILSMACRPGYNPNHYKDFPDKNRRNIAILDSYEPGSTFKIITAAAALEEGLVKPEETFNDPGFLVVEDRRLKCWKHGGHGTQNFIEAAENSCNPVFATLALRTGKEKMYQYIDAFGFGKPTGVDFPGDSLTAGVMADIKNVGDVELATIGFGQGISVTPLQLVRAVAAIANEGFLMQPRLVKEIRNSKGEVIERFRPVTTRQVVSRETARTLNRILQSVVVNGSGKNAGVPGYAVAGKTGTAQKPGKGGYGDKRVASFVGFAPADNPRLAVLVVLDEPNAGTSFGSVLAAPVFKSIVQDSLRYLKVQPTQSSLDAEEDEKDTVTLPDFVGMTAEEASETVAKLGIKVRTKEEGDVVRHQIPRAGAVIPKDTTLVLYFKNAQSYNKDDGLTVVPDVTGMTMKDAAKALSDAGLRISPIGSGFAASQKPSSGTEVEAGRIIRVFFEPNPQ